MKILNRIYFILLITIVYCTSINYAQSNRPILINNSSDDTRQSYFIEASNDFNNAIPSEKINVVNYVYSQVLRLNHDHFLAKNQAPESYLKSSFFIIFKISQILIIPFQETDIIFPFNYFW